MKSIMSMALSPTTATANQRASWLPARIPAAAICCRTAMMSVIQPQAHVSNT
jgi:hypothetical protein